LIFLNYKNYSRATLIDAYLFGYLSVINRAPFINSQLKLNLQKHANLVSYLIRIQREILGFEKQGKGMYIIKKICLMCY
jgi:hypothetical protein